MSEENELARGCGMFIGGILMLAVNVAILGGICWLVMKYLM